MASECRSPFYCLNGRCDGEFKLGEACEHLEIGSMCLPPYQCNFQKCKIPETYGCHNENECFRGYKCDDFPFEHGRYHGITGYKTACREKGHIIGTGSTSFIDTIQNFMKDPRRCDRALFTSLVRYWEFSASHAQSGQNSRIARFHDCPNRY